MPCAAPIPFNGPFVHRRGAVLVCGVQHYSGLEEAVYRNIDACKQISQIVRTSFGPNGMNKMIVNHLDKLFVTNDAATIIRELEVEHPAAKMLILASQQQVSNVLPHMRLPSRRGGFTCSGRIRGRPWCPPGGMTRTLAGKLT